MIKVLFVIHDLSVGGAEKVLVNLVNNMDQTKFDITVLSLFDEGVNRQFLHKNITYCYAFKKAIRGNSHLMKLLTPGQLYKWLIPDEYDVVVSYLEGPAARVVAGCPRGKVKVVSWIHSTFHNQRELIASFRNLREARACYDRADTMVFVSQEVQKAFLNVCPVQGRTCVLYNTNESEKILRLAQEAVKTPDFRDGSFYWCGVGKLVPNKGFDRMLHIQKRLLSEGYRVKLLILGAGWQQKDLEKWCTEHNLSDTVMFLGYQTNPYQYVAKCDLFVCASYAEGFSTAATEALIVGTPVCTVEVSGMREMLGEDSQYGLIVPNDEEALYQGIKSLLDQPERLAEYRRKAAVRGKTFSTHETVEAVQEMLTQLVSEKSEE